MNLHRFLFHSCFPPIFEFMTVEHKNFEDSFGSTCEGGGDGLLSPSVSTLDAAIIVFYMEKKIVCT